MLAKRIAQRPPVRARLYWLVYAPGVNSWIMANRPGAGCKLGSAGSAAARLTQARPINHNRPLRNARTSPLPACGFCKLWIREIEVEPAQALLEAGRQLRPRFCLQHCWGSAVADRNSFRLHPRFRTALRVSSRSSTRSMKRCFRPRSLRRPSSGAMTLQA